MQQQIAIAVLVKAREGVDYRKGKGAFCPCCGQRLKVVKTLKGRPRIRYCKCLNESCPLCVLDFGVKAV